MRRNGEDIIVTNVNELTDARTLASKLSKSRNHGSAYVWYIDSQTKKLTRETYIRGERYGIDRNAQTFPGNAWFSTGKTNGITILDAMHRYAESEYVRRNAERLGATGSYSKY